MSLTILNACDYNDVNKSGDYYRVNASEISLTKIIRRDGSKKSASFPKIYKLGEFIEPNTLEELLPTLKYLGKQPQSVVIRFKYNVHSKGDKVKRREEFVHTVPSHIVAIDVDELPRPSHISATDLKAQGEYVCHLLHNCHPEIFPDDMGFIAQASSSAGFSENIKLHLWLRNYDKVDQAQLRNLFYHINGLYKKTTEHRINLVDPALYHVVQPHYTAYPLFEDPTQDPFEERTVYHYGNDCYIPQTYSPYVKPIKATEGERDLYIGAIEGSLVVNERLDARIERLKGWEATNSGFRTAVIGVYHTAMQDQFCLSALSCILKPIIDNVRPGAFKDYTTQGEISALNHVKACSVRILPTECKGLKLQTICGGKEVKYLNISKDFPEDTVTFLKATLGTGKTHTIEKMLSSGKIDGKFLAITDTSALVESNAIRFGAGDFRQEKARLDFATGKSNRLSGTLHSLKKIRGMKFDFMFIDEADSLMNNLLFASIIKEEDKAQITEILAELLIQTDRVVISDGDISEETVACYVDLMEGSRNLARINHKRKNLQDIVANQHTKESSLWGALSECLALGDKCLLVSDSSPKSLNEYLIALQNRHVTKNIEVVHSASKMDDVTKDIVNNTTKALRKHKIDALLCSPSITNGVDFNYFDTVFVLTTTENHTPNMRYQAMMRERQPKSIHYFFRNMKSYSTGYNGLTVDSGFTSKARQAMALRREREYTTYVATFNYYLVDAGAKIRVEDEHYESPLDAEARESAHIERIEAILRSSPNNMIDKHNDAYEVKQLLKYYYDLEEEPTWDECDEFITNMPDKRAAYLHKVYKQFWHILKLNDPAELAEFLKTKEGFKFHLATGESIAGGVHKAQQILRRCGIIYDEDFPERNPSTEALKWYKKYCEITDGVEVPLELRDSTESTRDL